MRGLGNRIGGRARAQEADSKLAVGPTPPAKDKKSGAPTAAEAGRDAAYASALNMLQREHAAGRLDEDLVAAGARSLGDTYRKKHLNANPNSSARRIQAAFQGENEAYQARRRLLGSGSKDPHDSALSAFHATVASMDRMLSTVRREGETADRRNNGQPIEDHSLPIGWEQPTLEHIAKIRAIVDRMELLVRTHEKAAKDFVEKRQ